MSTEAASPTCSRWLNAPMRTLSPIVQFLMTVGPSMLTHLASKQTVSPQGNYDKHQIQLHELSAQLKLHKGHPLREQDNSESLC